MPSEVVVVLAVAALVVIKPDFGGFSELPVWVKCCFTTSFWIMSSWSQITPPIVNGSNLALLSPNLEIMVS